MEQSINRQVRLKSRPVDIPQAEHFEIVNASVPDLMDNEVLVCNIFLSVEPAMRGWVSDVANYSEPIPLGAVMRALAVGRVEASRHSDFRPGEFDDQRCSTETLKSGRSSCDLWHCVDRQLGADS